MDGQDDIYMDTLSSRNLKRQRSPSPPSGHRKRIRSNKRHIQPAGRSVYRQRPVARHVPEVNPGQSRETGAQVDEPLQQAASFGNFYFANENTGTVSSTSIMSIEHEMALLEEIFCGRSHDVAPRTNSFNKTRSQDPDYDVTETSDGSDAEVERENSLENGNDVSLDTNEEVVNEEVVMCGEGRRRREGGVVMDRSLDVDNWEDINCSSQLEAVPYTNSFTNIFCPDLYHGNVLTGGDERVERMGRLENADVVTESEAEAEVLEEGVVEVLVGLMEPVADGEAEMWGDISNQMEILPRTNSFTDICSLGLNDEAPNDLVDVVHTEMLPTNPFDDISSPDPNGETLTDDDDEEVERRRSPENADVASMEGVTLLDTGEVVASDVAEDIIVYMEILPRTNSFANISSLDPNDEVLTGDEEGQRRRNPEGVDGEDGEVFADVAEDVIVYMEIIPRTNSFADISSLDPNDEVLTSDEEVQRRSSEDVDVASMEGVTLLDTGEVVASDVAEDVNVHMEILPRTNSFANISSLDPNDEVLTGDEEGQRRISPEGVDGASMEGVMLTVSTTRVLSAHEPLQTSPWFTVLMGQADGVAVAEGIVNQMETLSRTNSFAEICSLDFPGEVPADDEVSNIDILSTREISDAPMGDVYVWSLDRHDEVSRGSSTSVYTMKTVDDDDTVDANNGVEVLNTHSDLDGVNLTSTRSRANRPSQWFDLLARTTGGMEKVKRTFSNASIATTRQRSHGTTIVYPRQPRRETSILQPSCSHDQRAVGHPSDVLMGVSPEPYASASRCSISTDILTMSESNGTSEVGDIFDMYHRYSRQDLGVEEEPALNCSATFSTPVHTADQHSRNHSRNHGQSTSSRDDASEMSSAEATILDPTLNKLYHTFAKNTKALRGIDFAPYVLAWATHPGNMVNLAEPPAPARNIAAEEPAEHQAENCDADDESEDDIPLRKRKKNVQEKRNENSVTTSRIVRQHCVKLMKRTRNDMRKLSPIYSVPRGRVLTFKATGENGPSVEDFGLFLEKENIDAELKAAVVAWNDAARKHFKASLFAEHPHQKSNRTEVDRCYKTHVSYLRDEFTRQNTRNHRSQVKAEKISRRINRRRDLWKRRLAALRAYRKHPRIKVLYEFAKLHLSWDVCSGDESPDECSGETVRRITTLPWRAKEIRPFMDTLDLLSLSLRFPDGENATPGKFPAERLLPQSFDPPQPACEESTSPGEVFGLPINFYGEEWMVSKPERREQLRPAQALDLTFPPEIVQIAFNCIPATSSKARPLPMHYDL